MASERDDEVSEAGAIVDFFGDPTDDGTPSNEREPSLVLVDGQPRTDPPMLLPPHLLPSKLLLRRD